MSGYVLQDLSPILQFEYISFLEKWRNPFRIQSFSPNFVLCIRFCLNFFKAGFLGLPLRPNEKCGEFRVEFL